MSYRPQNPTPEQRADGATIPFGVRLLALLAGTVFLLLAGKSVMQDYRLYYKLTHLDELYEDAPATWLKVEVRRDASGRDEFYPDILFDAHVNGTSIWGWRLSLEEGPADSAYWVERLASYHVGDSVTAYVNPDDPKDSFIEKKIRRDAADPFQRDSGSGLRPVRRHLDRSGAPKLSAPPPTCERYRRQSVPGQSEEDEVLKEADLRSPWRRHAFTWRRPYSVPPVASAASRCSASSAAIHPVPADVIA